MTDDEFDEFAKRVEQQDKEKAEAEKIFGAAIRRYLWEMTRIWGCPEWETDLDFILHAIVQATLSQASEFPKLTPEELEEIIDPLTVHLANELASIAEG